MKLNAKYLILVAILISYQPGNSENKGLENCGNSCYFNASLQALSHLDQFNTQLRDNLYDPNDLIPRFYVNLMKQIKAPGTINRNYKYTNLNNYTEQNFYDLVGTAFFFRGNRVVASQKPINIPDKYITELDENIEIEGILTTIKNFTIDGKHFLDKLKKDNSAFISEYITTKTDNGDFIKYFLRKQEDASEFIISLFNKLDSKNYLSNGLPNPFTFINNKSNSIVQCTKCNFKSINNQPCNILLLDIDPKNHTLVDCFNLLTLYELLDGNNKYQCKNCGPQAALKYSRLEITSKYLIIQLKRFEYDYTTMKQKKITLPVLFPLQLTLNEKCEFLDDNQKENPKYNNLCYKLLAFIVHGGATADSGHYWAYGKDKVDNWYLYNDSAVSLAGNNKSLQPDDLVQKVLSTGLDNNNIGYKDATPYILFYELEEPLQEKLSDLKASLKKLKAKLLGMHKALKNLKYGLPK